MASVRRTSFLSVMLVLCLGSAYWLNLAHARITNYAALPGLIGRSINMAVMEFRQMKQLERQHHTPGGNMRMPFNHMHHAHILTPGDAAVAADMNDKSYITVRATQELVRLTNTPLHLLLTDPAVALEWRRQIAPHCNLPLIRCNPTAPYRTADGTCNNLQNPTWGASMRPQLRYLPSQYDDGISSPRQRSVTGRRLASARDISNNIHGTGTSFLDEEDRSNLLVSWGSLLAFDIIRTPVTRGPNNTDLTCCPFSQTLPPSCFPIEVPRGDQRFQSNCMNFVRSAMAPTQLCDMGIRNQENAHTSFVDSSMLYGSTQEAQTRLREGRGGKQGYENWGDNEKGYTNKMKRATGFLKMGPNGLLPPAPDNTCRLSATGEFCFDAGDPRNTVLPTLASLYTILLREHNRIARQLQMLNPSWSDERLFQETRKIISALFQHITYNEYLPHIISDAHMRTHGLYSAAIGHQTVYNPRVNPTTSNVVGAAAFRSGHTTVTDTQGLKDLQTHETVEVRLESTYLRPNLLFVGNGQGTDMLNFWLLNSKQAKTDRFIQDSIRNYLLLDDNGVSFDLAAINIQRGRDHGLPSYNAWRRWCGLQPALHFGVGPGGLIHHDPQSAIRLATIYKHPDDIDLFPGGLSEPRVRGSINGPTFSCILAKQFQSYKQGDRFWYENNDLNTGFNAAQLNEIKKVRLSQIMCRNAGIQQIQPNAFRVPSLQNPLVSCGSLPSLDLRHWSAGPQRLPLNRRILLNRQIIVPNNPVTIWTASSPQLQTWRRSIA